MTFKAATKAEVTQVAHDLLDPLMEGVHQDVANLRAEVVHLQKELQQTKREMVAQRDRFEVQIKRSDGVLGRVLARLAELENKL